MQYLPFIILLAAGVVACVLQWTVNAVKDLRNQLRLVKVSLRAQENKTERIGQHVIRGRKPDIVHAPQLDNACQLRVAHGTPILVMPNGEILPNQMDLSVEHPFGGGKQLPKVTVTMYVNVEDSYWQSPNPYDPDVMPILPDPSAEAISAVE